jgi:hypothetical protein
LKERIRSDQVDHRPDPIRSKLKELRQLVDVIADGGEGCEKAATYKNIDKVSIGNEGFEIQGRSLLEITVNAPSLSTI